MRNNKLWSVLLAAVLLCACVVGVLFVGAQAEGQAYAWYVDGVGTAENSYATIDAAMTAAKAKTWVAGDSLTIYVTASGTTSTFNTKHIAGEVDTGRNLFNVITLFRADNTKLPITIDGDNPATTDAVEQNTLLMTTPVWTLNSKKSFSATNDYTFKNLDLSSWGDSANAFYAGAGKVTFDNVNFGSTQTMIITPSVGGWTPFINWTPDQFNANADADGYLPTGFTFINTDYGMNDGTLICRPFMGGIANAGTATGGGLTIKNAMLRNKIVIGEGSDVAYVNHQSSSTYTYIQQEPIESIIEVNGGNVTNLKSVPASTTAYVGLGNTLVANIKAGTVTNLNMGPSAAGGKYTGNIEINWTGGTVTNYKSITAGAVTGTLTNNVVGKDVSAYTATGFNMAGTLNGTIHNIYENCTISGSSARFMGSAGKVKNIINTLKGTFTTDNANLYLGTNSQTVSGTITNNIACEFKTPNGGLVYGGNNGAKTTGKITNNIYDGAKITVFIAGSNGTASGTNGIMAGGVETNVYGGEIGSLICGGSINNPSKDSSIMTTVLGGIITNYYGFCSEGNKATQQGTATKVENIIGKVNEDGTYSGDAVITNFFGGYGYSTYSGDPYGAAIGEIINKVYSGTITKFEAGSARGSVGNITNSIFGGTIDNYYGANSTNGSIAKVENIFGQVNEDGTYSGDAWIKKFYGGACTSSSTDIGEIVNTFYSVKFGAEVRDEGKAWSSASNKAYGGSSVGKLDKITNNIYGGEFNVGYFYGGNVNANATFDTTYTLAEGEYRVTNNVFGGHFARYCGGSEAGDALSIANFVKGTSHGSITVRQGAFYAGQGASANTDIYNEISGFGPVDIQGELGNYTADLSKNNVTFFGGNNGETVQAKSVTNVVKNGVQIDNFYGACNGGKAPKEITNHIYDANITTFYAGSKSCSYRDGITKITNTVEKGTITEFFGGYVAANVGMPIDEIENNIKGGTIGSFCGAHETACDSNGVGKIGKITNNFTGGEITGNFIAGAYGSSKPAAAATEDCVFEITEIVNNIGSDSIETRPTIGGNFFGGCYNVPSDPNANKVVSYYSVDSITNTFDHVFIDNNSYLGTRYNTLKDVTNYINNLEIDGNLVLANNVGNFNGTATTNIQNLSIRVGSVVADVNSSSCVVGDNAQFIVNILEGAKITLDKDATFNLNGNFPEKGTHTINAAAFDLIQSDYWVEGTTYLTAPEGSIPASCITIVDNVPGKAEVSNDKVVGRSSLSFVEGAGVNFSLSSRVAVNFYFNEDILSQYDSITATVGGKAVITEVNGKVLTVYGIGLKDFAKEIAFGGKLPTFTNNSILQIAQSGAQYYDIYKAIADFATAYAGTMLGEDVEVAEVTHAAGPNATPDYTKLLITGKNLIMSDALGFRYYGELQGETAIEDVKVFFKGEELAKDCYTVAFVGDSKTEITIDFYVSIKMMDQAINFQIVADDTVVLDFTDYGDAVAYKIMNAEGQEEYNKNLAKAALAYIQAAAKL